MAINFPSKSDVQLENSPLVEVVCQIRFPPILRINNEEPSEFQEEIRERFPKIEIEQGILFRIPVPGRESTPSAEAQSKNYRFRTLDEQTTVSLAPDFYALSTHKYTHWSEFAEYLKHVDEAVKRVYKPAFGTRIGLRFINRITSENTGLQTMPEILNLFNPKLTAFTQNNCWSDPQEMQSRLLLSDGDARLNLRIGYGTDKSGIPSFLLDFDYYETGELPLTGLIERCNDYHDVIYRAFRWCIPDEYLDVFESMPEEK